MTEIFKYEGKKAKCMCYLTDEPQERLGKIIKVYGYADKDTIQCKFRFDGCRTSLTKFIKIADIMGVV